VTGFGQHSGFYPRTKSMVNGLLQEKSISVSQEVMHLVTQLGVMIPLLQLFIGDQVGTTISTRKLMPNTLFKEETYMIASTFMDYIGTSIKCIPTWTMTQIEYLKLTSMNKAFGREVGSHHLITIPGKVEVTVLRSIRNFISL
jgi:hypothetical protein